MNMNYFKIGVYSFEFASTTSKIGFLYAYLNIDFVVVISMIMFSSRYVGYGSLFFVFVVLCLSLWCF